MPNCEVRVLPARIIAIEGIDQSGKKTQTKLLAQSLRNRGYKVGTVSFPVYRSPSGHQIRAYLDGKYRLPFPGVCILYSLNRWEHLDLLAKQMAESHFLAANRYTPSGLAYGMAGGLKVRWLKSLDEGLPQPNKVIVLDVPIDASFARKRRGRDVHEASATYLHKVRESYLKLASRHHWCVVDGTDSMREVQERIRKCLRLA